MFNGRSVSLALSAAFAVLALLLASRARALQLHVATWNLVYDQRLVRPGHGAHSTSRDGG